MRNTNDVPLFLKSYRKSIACASVLLLTVTLTVLEGNNYLSVNVDRRLMGANYLLSAVSFLSLFGFIAAERRAVRLQRFAGLMPNTNMEASNEREVLAAVPEFILREIPSHNCVAFIIVEHVEGGEFAEAAVGARTAFLIGFLGQAFLLIAALLMGEAKRRKEIGVFALFADGDVGFFSTAGERMIIQGAWNILSPVRQGNVSKITGIRFNVPGHHGEPRLITVSWPDGELNTLNASTFFEQMNAAR
jgi:uncharacterized protein YaiE (UPF0345 family)